MTSYSSVTYMLSPYSQVGSSLFSEALGLLASSLSFNHTHNVTLTPVASLLVFNPLEFDRSELSVVKLDILNSAPSFKLGELGTIGYA